MRRLILTILTIIYFAGQGIAQKYPVAVTPQVNAPAPVNFYNYADATAVNSPLRVQLLLNDITISNEQIRLKVYFEGNGIAFQSNDVVIGADPLFIDGGVTLTLTNTELAPYFEFQNIQGITPNVYGQFIPEGSYQFCFEVFDFTTGNRLSSKSCATTYIYKNEPPILNLPFNKSNIEAKEVENIVFQWTPRHINVSNVEYELSIVEIWDDHVDPQAAFLSSQPVFETITRNTSFVYGPTQPLLLPNKRYAWRVKAKALQGAEEIGLFRNEGYSEVFWFSRTSPCSELQFVSAEPKGISKINVHWDEDPNEYSEYTIAYREAGKPNAYWFTKRTNSGWLTIWNLKPGTTYEYKVKAKCKYQYGEYSDIQDVTTDTVEDETADYNCGIGAIGDAIDNQKPHPGLQIGERIKAGDFIVTIVEIDSQSDGRITGRGYVGIPYLKFTRFGVKFNNVLINTDSQLADGEIVTLYDHEYGEDETMTVDLDIDVVETITGDQGETDSVEIGFVIENVTINEYGAIVITGTGGEEATVPGGRDIEIKDANGKVWSVGEDNVVKVSEYVGEVTDATTEGVDEDGEILQISDDRVLVTFIKSGYYYFDELPEEAKGQLGKNSIYATIPIKGGGAYQTAFKGISDTNGDDIIIAEATIKDESIATEDIIFKTKSGTAVSATWNGNKATLTLTKRFDYAHEEILATVKSEEEDKYSIVGVLNLVHLGSNQFSDINVKLIPINKAIISREAQDGIKEIYKKAGVNLNIEVGNRLQIPQEIWDKEEPYDILNAGDSRIFNDYSEEEKDIISYYKSNTSDYNEETYYVFITDIKAVNSDTQKSLGGFMPIKNQFGFLFDGAGNDAKIVAHELGHGIFGLKHPFSEHGTTAGATNFMMDYGTQEVFNHMDWKEIFAPGLKLYDFSGDEDGEIRLFDDTEFVNNAFQIIRYAYMKSKGSSLNFDTSVFGKMGTFYGKWKGDKIWIKINKGSFKGVSVDKPVELGKNASKDKKEKWRYALLYKNVEIYTPRWSSGADPNELLRLKEYLFPADKSIIKNDLNVSLEIKEHSTLLVKTGGVYYELNFKTKDGDHIFEFDHHDEVEKFCNSLKIERDKEYTNPYESEYSKKIIDYLNKNFASKAKDCDLIDTYYAEIPSSYILQVQDNRTEFDYEGLWQTLKVLLSCSTDDKGVSEEDAVLTILKALSKGSKKYPNINLLQDLKDRKINGENAFRLIYDKVDDWGGTDNFTKLINLLYEQWKISEDAKQTVYLVPYTSSKIGVFYTSDYVVNFKEDPPTSISLGKKELLPYNVKLDKYPTQIVNIGTYDIYDPIRLVKYNEIAKPGFNVKQVNVPMFILKAIDEKYNTNNTEQSINLAFEVALTFSGIGNITRLRHLKQLNKLDKLFDGLQGVDTALGALNLILKYSDACGKDPNEIKPPTNKEEMTYCQMLSVFGDILGLSNGAIELGKRSAEITDLARKMHKKIDEDPNFIDGITNSDRQKLLRYLKKIADDIGENVKLKVLVDLYNEGTLKTILYNFENVKLGISTVETLLKYSEDCKTSDTCKEVLKYLGFVQTAIKAGGLTGKVISGLKKGTSDKIKNDQDIYKEAPEKRKRLIESVEILEGIRVPALKRVLSDFPDGKGSKIKQLYDNASTDKKTELEKAWKILEPYPKIRFARDGKNLETLAKTYSRFTYDGEDGFNGFHKLINEGVSTSKQKLIQSLEKANDLFDINWELPIVFSGIKSGKVKVITIIDGKNVELASVDYNGIVVKKKFLTEEDGAQIVGEVQGKKIYKRGNEIGFKRTDGGIKTDLKFGKNTISALKNGFPDEIASIVAKHGIDEEYFQKIFQKMKYHLLSPEDQAIIKEIRNATPMPNENTILQKVAPLSNLKNYLGEEGYTLYNTIGGFITRAKDAKHLNSYKDIFHGMRLDYKGTKFKLSDGYCIVIKYRAKNPTLKIPFGEGQPYPYTGNGHTSGNQGRLGVPELESSYVTPKDGAELFLRDSEGEEILVAVFSESENRFIKVNNDY
ncbi:fibronectin type III domain-containing protein [Aquimarina sp. 2201CG1-2-11]|uniref:fibronectin type III domain-containing protein n=1 Tax=Aquimarina discodermiae TaxID=3231043 RepID=UPI003461F2D3